MRRWHWARWFIGYTPTITAGVWVGGEDRQIHFDSIALGGGSNMALPIWGLFMKKVLRDGTLGVSEEDHFTPPSGVVMNIGCDALATRAPGEKKTVESQETAEEEYYFE